MRRRFSACRNLISSFAMGPPRRPRSVRAPPSDGTALADDAVVLVDDAETAIGRGVLARWTEDGLARVELRERRASLESSRVRNMPVP